MQTAKGDSLRRHKKETIAASKKKRQAYEV